MSLVATYLEWADAQEARLLDWVDPEGGYKLSPLHDAPYTKFSFVIAAAVAYLAFVLLGSLLMKCGVPAFNTTPLQFIYNPIQMILCSYVFMETVLQAFKNNYSFMPCNAYVAANPVMGNVVYAFYLSKYFDYFDTLFIIAGKKWNQLSFLHVFHHISVPIFTWIDVKTVYDGDIYLNILLNSFIHVIMYSYYFISMHTKNIWWKKLLTKLQLIQFITMNVQGYLYITKDCQTFPIRAVYLYIGYVQSLFWLFVHFFIRAYFFKKPAAKKLDDGAKTKKTQ